MNLIQKRPPTRPGIYIICFAFLCQGLSLYADEPPISVAIISDEVSRNDADIILPALTEQFSNITFLERIDLSSILHERELVAEDFSSQLKGATLVIFIERFTALNREFIGTRFIRTKDGWVQHFDIQRADKSSSEIQSRITQKAVQALEEHRFTNATKTKSVSLQGIVGEFAPGEVRDAALIGNKLQRLIAASLSAHPELRVLERSRLVLPDFEKFLTGIDQSTFPPANYVINGSVNFDPPENSYLLKFSKPPSVEITSQNRTIQTDSLEALASDIAHSISEHIAADTDRKPNPRMNDYRRTESEGFYKEGVHALKLGLHGLASNYAETADILDQSGDYDIDFLRIISELLSHFDSTSGYGFTFTKHAWILYDEQNSLAHENLADLLSPKHYANSPFSNEKWDAVIECLKQLHELKKRTEESISMSAPFRTRMRNIETTINPLVKDLIWQSLEQGEETEQEHLLQLIAAAKNYSSRTMEELVDSSPIANDFLTHLALTTSQQEAIAYIRKSLYENDFEELHSQDPETAHAAAEEIYWARSKIFHYFRFKAYLESGEGTANLYTVEKYFDRKFVARLSPAPLTFEEAAIKATDSVGDTPLNLLDQQFMRLARLTDREKQSETYLELCNLLLSNAGILSKKKMLGIYLVYLIELDGFIGDQKGYRGGLKSPNESTPVFWRKMLFEAMDSSDPFCLTLLDRFWDRLATSEAADDPPQYLTDFLSELQLKIRTYNESAPENFAFELETLIYSDILETYKVIPKQKKPSEGLINIPDEETLRIGGWAKGDGHLYLLATAEHNDHLFTYSIAYSDEHGYKPSFLSFNISGDWFMEEKITVPDELHYAHLSARTPTSEESSNAKGTLQVTDDEIIIAIPGVIGTYDRISKKWQLEKHPFLATQNHFQFVGRDLITASQSSRNGSITPPVQGLYCLKKGGWDPFAIIDTSRRPAVAAHDRLSNLPFSTVPIAMNDNAFLIGLVNGQTMDFIRFNKDRTGLEFIPFKPERNALANAQKTGRYTHVVAAERRNYNSRQPTNLDYRLESTFNDKASMQIGAFAFDNELKEYIWLLDSGSGQKPATNSNSTASQMIPLEETPQFPFPEDLTHYAGKRFNPPAMLYDGTKLIVVSSQYTDDGRRIMYLWPDRRAERPIRIALKVDCKLGGNADTEYIKNFNTWSRNSITRIFGKNKQLIFATERGYLSVSYRDIRSHLDKRGFP